MTAKTILTGVFFEPSKRKNTGTWKAIIRRAHFVKYVPLKAETKTKALKEATQVLRSARAKKSF